ncbi:hypothetical protein MIND_01222200 [Mycena indigotica]|uniref:F-box domain-containing protein n=1 Tax=Mycena indigotica TaxID=2126181 RepID=A0A8H6S3B4_9AGAR|nr:uncharacterized protein MIND_01222200 [Mycena indigotica]KAF7291966.1 hypothetical protein MIND_01222200 [Mycena indigotica]
MAWSDLPAELALQIASHNVNEMQTLRTMCLVSKSMRDAAIEPLFSVLHFSRNVDLLCWLALAQRAPSLLSAVRKLKLTIGLSLSATNLSAIPTLENVCELELSGLGRKNAPELQWSEGLEAIASYLEQSLPNLRRLSLSNSHFWHLAQLSRVIRAAASLESLAICASSVISLNNSNQDVTNIGRVPVNLAGLRELALIGNHREFDSDGQNSLGRMMLLSPPTQLRVLTLLSFHESGYDNPCSIMTMIMLMRTSYAFLTHLTIDPNLRHRYENPLLTSALPTLPPFAALLELTIHLGALGSADSSGPAAFFFAALKPMPKLTIVRFVLRELGTWDYTSFMWLFSSHPSLLHENSLQRRFPSLEAIHWVFCVDPRGDKVRLMVSKSHKLDIERRLLLRLENVGMSSQWICREWIMWQDRNYRPMVWED